MNELEYMMAPGIYSPEAKYVDGIKNHLVYKDGKEYATKIICCNQCKSKIDFTDNDIIKTMYVNTSEIRESFLYDRYRRIHENIEQYLCGYIKCPKCKSFLCVKKLHMRTVDSKLIYDGYQRIVDEDKKYYDKYIRMEK